MRAKSKLSSVAAPKRQNREAVPMLLAAAEKHEHFGDITAFIVTRGDHAPLGARAFYKSFRQSA